MRARVCACVQARLEPGWRFVGAEAAHAHTERELRRLCGEPLRLTGEPAGRQEIGRAHV